MKQKFPVRYFKFFLSTKELLDLLLKDACVSLRSPHITCFWVESYLTGWKGFLLRSDWDCSIFIVWVGDSTFNTKKYIRESLTYWCIVHVYLYVSMTLKQTICMFKFIENWGHPFPLQTTQIFVVPWFHWNVGRMRQFSWRPLEWWHSAHPQTPACAPSPESGSSSDTQTNRRAVKS